MWGGVGCYVRTEGGHKGWRVGGYRQEMARCCLESGRADASTIISVEQC